MKVLVIAAHPDDEILGCGASIALHAKQGDEIKHIILATGLTSRGKTSRKELNELRNSSIKAAASLGAIDVKHYDFPDNAMDGIELIEIVKTIESILEEYKADIIYTHFPHDLNIDHQLISRAVVTAARPTTDSSVSEIRFFEVVSSTEWSVSLLKSTFTPNFYIDVSSTLDDKLKALSHYNSEMRPFPHPRSFENVVNKAKVRGAEAGFVYSEAFVTAFRRADRP